MGQLGFQSGPVEVLRVYTAIPVRPAVLTTVNTGRWCLRRPAAEDRNGATRCCEPDRAVADGPEWCWWRQESPAISGQCPVTGRACRFPGQDGRGGRRSLCL